jgi:hypothetical protein
MSILQRTLAVLVLLVPVVQKEGLAEAALVPLAFSHISFQKHPEIMTIQ